MTKITPPAIEDRTDWIFDLDNTLYPATAPVGVKVSQRMTEYIAERFEIDEEEAFKLRRQLFHTYGTTLRGLMTLHGVDPDEYLDFVHSIDLSDLLPNPALARAIAALPGRKYVFTNASARHAERVIDRLGITDAFNGIFDIVDSDFIPKPDPSCYQRLLDRFGIVSGRAAMFEDIARNLHPAHDLGMLTVWVDNPNDWAREGWDEPWVHYRTDDLAAWLAASQTGAAKPGTAHTRAVPH